VTMAIPVWNGFTFSWPFAPAVYMRANSARSSPEFRRRLTVSVSPSEIVSVRVSGRTKRDIQSSGGPSRAVSVPDVSSCERIGKRHCPC
jgi:hypothetical protein